MATRIAIDTIGATGGLRDLTNAVRSTIDAWKAQEIAMKSAGDMIGASQVRYNGLGETIERQKAKISELTQRQESLINVSKENVQAFTTYEDKVSALRNQLQNLDTSTESGRQKSEQLKAEIERLGQEFQKSTGITQKDASAYLKLQKNINSAEKQLAAYENQQQKAREMMKYYTSGLADLQKNYRLTNAASKAYVERMQAEGHESAANQSKVNGLRQSITNLSAQYKIQTSELQKIAAESGLTSSAYLKQKTRVDQTAASIAKLKDQLLIEQNNLTNVRKATDLATTASKSYVNSLTALGRNTEAQRVKLTNSINVHNKLTTQLNAEQKYLSELGETYGRTSTKYQEQAIKVNDLTSKYQANVLETRQLNRSVGEMSSRNIRLKDSFSIIGNAARDGFSKVRTGATYAAGGIAAFGVAAMSGAKRATSLQHTYQVNTNLLITGGEKASAAIKNVSQMQRDGEKYSLQYGKSQQAIAEQYQELIKRGYSSKQALGAMRSELQASVASGDDFNDVVKVSSQVVDAFGMRTTSTSKMVHNTRRVVNELAYSADMTATDFQKLGIGMSYVGDSAKTAGFSLAETSAAMGELSNHGLEADKAGTGLRKTIVSLAKPSKDATAALKSIGIQSTSVFKDANGNFKSLSDILGTINAHTKNLGSAQQAAVFKAIFGTTGMQSAQILAQNNTELTTLTRKVQEAGDKGNYVSQLAQKNAQTAQMSQQRFKQAWADLTIMFGSKMLPYMTEAANSLSKLFAQEGFRKDVKAAAGDIGHVAGGILNIAKFSVEHADAVKTFAKIVATIWVVDKVRKFARATQDMFDLLKIGRSNITREIEQVNLETQAYQRLAAAKTEANSVAATGGKAGSTASKAGNIAADGAIAGAVEKSVSKGSSRWNLLGKTVGARIINGAGLAITAWDVGSSVAKAVKTGKAKDAYSAAGKSVGTLIGGSIGEVIAGPGGAMIGAQLGDQIGGSKTVTNVIKGVDKLNKSVDKKPLKVKSKVTGLSKAAKKSVKSVRKDFKNIEAISFKIGTATDNKSLAKSRKELSKYYSDLKKQSDKSVHDRTKSEKSFLKEQLNAHNISQKQYNQYMAKLNKSDSDRVKKNRTALNNLKGNTKVLNQQIENLNKSHNQAIQKLQTKAAKSRQQISKNEHKALANLERNGFVTVNGQVLKGEKARQAIHNKYSNQRKKLDRDTNRKISNQEKSDNKARVNNIKDLAKKRLQEEKKLGADIAGNMTSSAKKQRQILQKLKSDKGHISEAEAKQLVTQSANAANKQIENANHERDETIKAARSKANKTIEHAHWMHDHVTGYTKQQMNTAIEHAKNERDNTIAMANEKRKETVTTAKDQNNQVVTAAKSESQSVSTHAKRSGENGVYAWRQHAGGIYDVVDWIANTLNQVGKALGGKQMSRPKSKINQAMPNFTIGATATGASNISASKINALVGEAGPEMVYKPYSGTARIIGQRGAEITQLEHGEYVLDAQKTAQVMAGTYRGILPGYAKGGIVGEAGDFVSNLVDKAKDFTGEISEAIQKILDQPEKAISGVLNKINGHGLGELGENWFDLIKKGLLDIWKKAISKIKKVIDEFGSSSNPGGSGVKRWIPVIKKAAAKMKVNLTDSALNVILRRIAQESNGNPTITNNWDSNAAAGHPSKGLLQYIQPTLSAWVPRGVKPDLASGYVQLLALFNDSNWLSDISVRGGWGPTGYKRFANGGKVNKEALYRLAEENKTEYIIPMDPAKRPRAIQLLQEIVGQFAKDSNVKETDSNAEASNVEITKLFEQIKESNTKFDVLLQMFQNLLGLTNEQIKSIKGINGYDPLTAYKQQNKDQRMANWQGLT